jgi:hypothetical protein
MRATETMSMSPPPTTMPNEQRPAVARARDVIVAGHALAGTGRSDLAVTEPAR